jgi:hypothetical protein
MTHALRAFRLATWSLALAACSGGEATLSANGTEAGTEQTPPETGTPAMGTPDAMGTPSVGGEGGVPPAGWLYTKGSKMYVSDGASGTAWPGG